MNVSKKYLPQNNSEELAIFSDLNMVLSNILLREVQSIQTMMSQYIYNRKLAPPFRRYTYENPMKALITRIP